MVLITPGPVHPDSPFSPAGPSPSGQPTHPTHEGNALTRRIPIRVSAELIVFVELVNRWWVLPGSKPGRGPGLPETGIGAGEGPMISDD